MFPEDASRKKLSRLTLNPLYISRVVMFPHITTLLFSWLFYSPDSVLILALNYCLTFLTISLRFLLLFSCYLHLFRLQIYTISNYTFHLTTTFPTPSESLPSTISPARCCRDKDCESS